MCDLFRVLYTCATNSELPSFGVQLERLKQERYLFVSTLQTKRSVCVPFEPMYTLYNYKINAFSLEFVHAKLSNGRLRCWFGRGPSIGCFLANTLRQPKCFCRIVFGFESVDSGYLLVGERSLLPSRGPDDESLRSPPWQSVLRIAQRLVLVPRISNRLIPVTCISRVFVTASRFYQQLKYTY